MRVTYRCWETEYDEEGWQVIRPAGASVRVDDGGGERVLEFRVPTPQIACDLDRVLTEYLREGTSDDLAVLAGNLHTLARRQAVEEVTRGGVHDPGCAKDHHPDAFCNPLEGG